MSSYGQNSVRDSIGWYFNIAKGGPIKRILNQDSMHFIRSYRPIGTPSCSTSYNEHGTNRMILLLLRRYLFKIKAPPEIEWWDEGLVNGEDYSAIDDPRNLKLEGDDSVVTIYIQHPVPLEPPQEKNMPAPKPMYLTPKEQKKLRRQRRMADLKEQPEEQKK